MRSVTRAELSGSQPVFLLDVSWGGKSYRFSTYPISIEKNDGSTISYDGGFSDPDLESSVDMLEASPEASAVAVEVVFPVDLVRELMQYGRSLETATAEISMVLERNGSIVQTYEDRIRMASGDVTDPIIGDPERSMGYAAFSIERNPNKTAELMIRPDEVITSEEFPLADAFLAAYKVIENSLGKNWPLVIGSPGANVTQATYSANIAQYNYPGSPAYLIQATTGTAIDNTDAVIRLLICTGEPVASTVGIQDYKGNKVSGLSVVTVPMSGGRSYSYVEFTYDVNGILHPWMKNPSPLSSEIIANAQTDDPMWWVLWDNGGGLENPFGGGVLESAGDIIRYGLSTTGADVDLQSWNNVSSLLNEYKFAGYVTEGSDSWWDWIVENMLDYLPIQVTDGADGLRAVVPLMLMPGYIPPRVSAHVGPGFQIVSALEPINEQDDIINKLRVIFAWMPHLETFFGDLSLSGQDSSSSSWKSYHSEIGMISENRYGEREAEIELMWVYDLTTATLISNYLLRRDALIRREIVVEADPEWGFLAPGDVVSVTSPEWYLSDHRMQVRSKSWIGSGWELRLELEENPMINIRS